MLLQLHSSTVNIVVAVVDQVDRIQEVMKDHLQKITEIIVESTHIIKDTLRKVNIDNIKRILNKKRAIIQHHILKKNLQSRLKRISLEVKLILMKKEKRMSG